VKDEMFISRPLTNEQWNKIRAAVWDVKQFLQNGLGLRNTFGDRVIIADEIRIYEGEGKNRKLRVKSKGHIVNQGLIAVTNLLSWSTITYAGSSNGGLSSYNFIPSGNSYIRLGTGGGATAGSTVSLSAPVATVPSSQAGTTSSPQTGQYRISWTATWNAGSLTAITVSEVGLSLAFGSSFSTLQSFGWSRSNTTVESVMFFSRLSSADNDFTAFTVNTAVPLTIEWRLTFTFA
jgi:hypothetical protein